jgi:chaperonin cofactor prefoldin
MTSRQSELEKLEARVRDLEARIEAAERESASLARRNSALAAALLKNWGERGRLAIDQLRRPS